MSFEGMSIRKNENSGQAPSRVVVVGGLGSQLCGYAFAQYLHAMRKHEVVIDTSEIDRGYTRHGVTIESLVLDGQFIDFRKERGKTKYAIERFYFGVASRLPGYMSSILPTPVYTAKEIGWSRIHELEPEGTVFRGEFFTTRYFMELKKQNLDFQFQLKKESPFYVKMRSELFGLNFLSIHVRRGDYVGLSGKFGLLDKHYYQRCLRELNHLGANWDRVLVFSDEIPAAKHLLEDLLSDEEVMYVNPPVGANPAESMGIMTHASYHVVANSSFSLWGALLSRNAKLVLAPNPWFLNSGTPEGLLPEDWVLIDSFY